MICQKNSRPCPFKISRTRRKTLSDSRAFQPSIHPCYHSSGWWTFWNQGRDVECMITSRQGTSFHVACELQCLSVLHFIICLVWLTWYYMFMLVFVFITIDLAIFSIGSYPHFTASWPQIQIFYWLAFSTLPKHQESAKTLDCLHCIRLRSSGPCVNLPRGIHLHSPQKLVLCSFHE